MKEKSRKHQKSSDEELRLISDIINRCRLAELEKVPLCTSERMEAYTRAWVGNRNLLGVVILTDNYLLCQKKILSIGGGASPVTFSSSITALCKQNTSTKIFLCIGHKISTKELFVLNELYLLLEGNGIKICDIFEVSEHCATPVLSNLGLAVYPPHIQ